MLKLFLNFLVVTAPMVLINSASGDFQVINVPNIEHYSKKVHIGSDGSMGLAGGELISLNPKFNQDGTLFIPSDLKSAMQEMYSAAPKWFIKALANSHNDFECSVVINGIDYTYIVDSWFYTNWKLHNDDSKLRQSVLEVIKDAGSEDMIFRGFLAESFCVYAKSGSFDEVERLSVGFRKRGRS
jgi:hypothetical protein